ncbi:MAG TPA: hypothetical protein VKG25_01155, partial [Bryobacteraceae bacterium]|nr:hypothetical protein [Bryobacteraceae bacterium]
STSRPSLIQCSRQVVYRFSCEDYYINLSMPVRYGRQFEVVVEAKRWWIDSNAAGQPGLTARPDRGTLPRREHTRDKPGAKFLLSIASEVLAHPLR